MFSPSLAVVVLLAGLSAQAGEETEALGRIRRAEALEAGLVGNESKLRLRDNLERLVRAWVEARQVASGEDRLTALRGEARAWKLLAHWSGRKDDRAQAAQFAARLERARSTEARSRVSEGKVWLPKVSVEVTEGSFQVLLPIRHETRARRGVLRKQPGAKASRIYYDVSPLVASRQALGTVPIDHASVQQVRVGQLEDRTVRFVFDLEPGQPEPEIVFQAEARGFKVTVPEARPLAGASPGEADPLSLLIERLEENLVNPKPSAGRSESSEARERAPEAAGRRPEKAAKNLHLRKIKLSRSTKKAVRSKRRDWLNGIRRVVIDPGHGGKDTGAVGRRRIKEKDINLAIALKLGEELKRQLDVKVTYTRNKDEFVSLKRRAVIANEAKADLFVSIHVNAHRNRKIRGIETYYLNTTSSRYASRLATRENTERFHPGALPLAEPDALPDEDHAALPPGALGRDLRLLLADLAMKSATDESRRLAGFVQSSVVGSLRRNYSSIRDLGVKQALFYVLLGVRMPSVLVESGFVTNAMEEKRLADPAYQVRFARAIANGIRRFVNERNEIASRF